MTLQIKKQLEGKVRPLGKPYNTIRALRALGYKNNPLIATEFEEDTEMLDNTMTNQQTDYVEKEYHSIFSHQEKYGFFSNNISETNIMPDD